MANVKPIAEVVSDLISHNASAADIAVSASNVNNEDAAGAALAAANALQGFASPFSRLAVRVRSWGRWHWPTWVIQLGRLIMTGISIQATSPTRSTFPLPPASQQYWAWAPPWRVPPLRPD